MRCLLACLVGWVGVGWLDGWLAWLGDWLARVCGLGGWLAWVGGWLAGIRIKSNGSALHADGVCMQTGSAYRMQGELITDCTCYQTRGASVAYLLLLMWIQVVHFRVCLYSVAYLVLLM